MQYVMQYVTQYTTQYTTQYLTQYLTQYGGPASSFKGKRASSRQDVRILRRAAGVEM
jgi:hypothetical protein